MSSTLSIKVWGWYAGLAGLSFLLVPEFQFSILGIEGEPDAWVRMIGALAVVLSIYYLTAARFELRPFYVATLFGRLTFAAFALIVAFGFGPWQIALFGILDLGGAAWTYVALRTEARAPTA